MKIIEAKEQHMPEVRNLFREYQQWLGVDLCFQGFEQELADLPGCYAPLQGRIWLAQLEDDLVGCVAVRPKDAIEAELKRLYVRPAFHGKGFGKQLFLAAMNGARTIGYSSIVLDTLPSMHTAQTMYRGYGFFEIEPYYDNPQTGVQYYRYQF